MDLKTYLSTLPRGSRAEFASLVGVDRVYLSQLASRKVGPRLFVPSAALSVRIEKETRGQVTRPELRPHDWQEIWPELVALAGPRAKQGVANA